MNVPALRHWLQTTRPEAREAAAREARTSVQYLYQLAGGHRRAGPQMARRLAAATGVPLHALRPDIWA